MRPPPSHNATIVELVKALNREWKLGKEEAA